MSPTGNATESALWELFTDWCLAVGEPTLPAKPMTLARFLADNPAGSETQRRRVGIVNAIHRRGGHPQPGRSETVRDLLDARRRERRQQHALGTAEVIAQLPETGWPTAVFARRDAMILVLSGSGLSAATIAGLHTGDIRAVEDSELLEITTADGTFTAGAELLSAGISPAEVWRSWDMVRRVQHYLPSTRRVVQLIEGKPLPPVGPAPDDAPLMVALDRWGAAEIRPDPLSASAVSGIISDHLQGNPAAHKPVQTPDAPTDPEKEPEPEFDPVILDQGVVSRGLAARRRDIDLLDGIGDQLDEVEARADALLEEMLKLLEQQGD
jgi:hypothetical protein